MATITKLEKKLFDEIEKNLNEGIVKERIIYLLNCYTKNADYYKGITYSSTILSIAIPASITFLNSSAIDVIPFLSEMNVRLAISILSGLSSVGAGIYAFLHSRENWIRYRVTVESIKRETVLYISSLRTGQPIYTEVEFMRHIESIAETEVNGWHMLRLSDTGKRENST